MIWISVVINGLLALGFLRAAILRHHDPIQDDGDILVALGLTLASLIAMGAGIIAA